MFYVFTLQQPNKNSFFEGTNFLFPYYSMQSVPLKNRILPKNWSVHKDMKCTLHWRKQIEALNLHLFFILKQHEWNEENFIEFKLIGVAFT